MKLEQRSSCLLVTTEKPWIQNNALLTPRPLRVEECRGEPSPETEFKSVEEDAVKVGEAVDVPQIRRDDAVSSRLIEDTVLSLNPVNELPIGQTGN